MSIQISTSGYNICKANIPEALTLNTKTKVGIEADFNFILGMVKMSGVVLENGEMYVTPSITNLT